MARRIRETTLLVVEAPTDVPLPLTQPAPTERAQAPTPVETMFDEEESAPLPVQPERARQYFEATPDEFGAWKIFVSAPADSSCPLVIAYRIAIPCCCVVH